MSIPGVDLNTIAAYKPKWAGVKELNIGNAWRATWVADPELPEGAPVLHAYVVVLCDEKGYVTRRTGTSHWGVAEGAVAAGETPEAFARRAAAEQTGAVAGEPQLLGYFECRATSYNPDFPAGTTTVRPIYLFAARKMQDLGPNANFERRRLPLNEFAKALRASYPELNESITLAVDRYLVQKAKGEI
jgi:ADP-ribose pyrophosphatase YjhB (NUDIX family)